MPQQNTQTRTPWERAMRNSIDGVPPKAPVEMATVLEQYHEAVTAPLVEALEAIVRVRGDVYASAADMAITMAHLAEAGLATERAAIQSAKAGA